MGFFGVLLFLPLILLLSLLALSPYFATVFPATAENGVGSLLLIVLVSFVGSITEKYFNHGFVGCQDSKSGFLAGAVLPSATELLSWHSH